MILLFKKCNEIYDYPFECGNDNCHICYIEVKQGTQKLKRLWSILGLRSCLFLIELGVGFWGHSLSLLAGSGHLFLDLVTLGLTLLAAWLVQRQSTEQVTFGYQHIEAKVGLLNGMSLMAIALLIAKEAVKHVQNPEPVLGLPMLIVAFLNMVISGLSVHLLHEDNHLDLNLRGVFLHGIADAASSIGLILAALAIYLFNWLWADAVASLLVAMLICFSAISLLGDSLRILSNESN